MTTNDNTIPDVQQVPGFFPAFSTFLDAHIDRLLEEWHAASRAEYYAQ